MSVLNMHIGALTARNADRDLAQQLEVVRALASRARPLGDGRSVAAPQARTSTEPSKLAAAVDDSEEASRDSRPRRPLFRVEEMTQRLAWAQRLRVDARDGVLSALERASKAGPMRRISVPGSSVEF